MSVDQPTLALIYRLAVALAIGLLAGIERGWREREMPEGGRTAGIRTFALIGLLGGAGGALFERAGPLPLAALLITVAAAFTWFKFRETNAEKDYSVTSVIAALLVFALGALAVVGSIQAAVAAGIAMVALLAARQTLHEWVKRLTWPELRSGLLLLAMTFLALPLLPDRPIDPLGAVNPHELWLLTILIAAISAMGYVAVKVGGPRRGLIFGGLASGLVSSTAVTLTTARNARAGGSSTLLAAAAALGSLASLARVYVLAIALAPMIWPQLAAALLPAGIVLGLACALVIRGSKNDRTVNELAEVKNPIEIKSVLGFGALLAIVFVAVKLAANVFGSQSFIELAALTGVADVDPITLTATKLAKQGLIETASIGVLVAVTVNMLVKTAIGWAVGGQAFGLRLSGFLLGSLIVGGIGLGVFVLAHG